MEYVTILLPALVAAVVVGPVCWYAAHRSGMHESLGLQKGTLVGTMDALQKIRKGDVDGGTQRIETMCFLSAVLLLDDGDYAANPTIKAVVPELVAYRDAYRTNQTGWTPVEERLQALLSHQ